MKKLIIMFVAVAVLLGLAIPVAAVTYPYEGLIPDGRAVRNYEGEQLDADPRTPEVDNLPKGSIVTVHRYIPENQRFWISVQLPDGSFLEGSIIGGIEPVFYRYTVTENTTLWDGVADPLVRKDKVVTSLQSLDGDGDFIVAFDDGEKGLIAKKALSAVTGTNTCTGTGTDTGTGTSTGNSDGIVTRRGAPLIAGERYVIVTSTIGANQRSGWYYSSSRLQVISYLEICRIVSTELSESTNRIMVEHNGINGSLDKSYVSLSFAYQATVKWDVVDGVPNITNIK